MVKVDRLWKRVSGLGITTLLLFTLMIAGIIWFQWIKFSYREDLHRIQEHHSLLRNEAQKAEIIKNKRIKYFKQQLLLGSNKIFSNRTARLIRQLSLIADNNTKILELQFIPRVQSFNFTLKGMVIGNATALAQSSLKRFYLNLKAWPNLLESKLISISMASLLDKKNDRAIGLVENKKPIPSILFTINGEFDLE